MPYNLTDPHSPALYMGFDIGGTKCAVLIGDGSGSVLHREVIATDPAESPTAVLHTLLERAHTMKATFSATVPLLAAGVSCGGPLNAQTGVICCPPNLPTWRNVPICRLISRALDCPCFLQNDADACALAEWKFGAGRGTQNMIFLTFGTGMGAGLILNGRLYAGSHGLAGEVGHIRLEKDGPLGYGKRGSFEGYCSGGGLARMAQAAWNRAFPSQPSPYTNAKELCANANAGDEMALAVIKDSAAHLGSALAIIIDILDPECIVIGSVFQRSEALFRPEMERIVSREALQPDRCRIVPAALGDALGDIAALTVAAYGIHGPDR